MITHQIKEQLGRTAAELVEDGMLVGLGTGSTAACFIAALGERVAAGLSITAVATSTVSAAQAAELSIAVYDIDDVGSIDLTVDGADEIDAEKRMIKGGGGALLKEKIVASRSKEMVVVVDESKCVERLGAFGLPIEVVRFGARSTVRLLAERGYAGSLRSLGEEFFVTDEGHYIIDIPTELLSDPEHVEAEIRAVPGVVDTGFFFGLAGRVLVGYADGKIETR